MLTINPDTLVFVNEEGVLQNSKIETDEDGNEKEIKNDVKTLTLNGILTTDTIKTKHLQTNTLAISDNITKIDEDTGEEMNASSIGTAVIPAGEMEVTVNTSAITEGSRVFVNPKIPLKQTLAATDIIFGKSFVVKLLDAQLSDLKFDWFIVGGMK
jgi:hypothetical protein